MIEHLYAMLGIGLAWWMLVRYPVLGLLLLIALVGYALLRV